MNALVVKMKWCGTVFGQKQRAVKVCYGNVLRDQNTKEAREALGNRGSMGVFHGLGFSVDGIGPRG